MPDNTNRSLSGATSIIGVGSTDYRQLKAEGKPVPTLELASRAIKLALDDAGLKLTNIDGLMTMNVAGDELALRLSMQDLRINADYAAGGRWVVPALQHAAQSLVAGSANAVVVVLALSRLASYADSAAPGGNAAFEAMQAMGGPGAHSSLMARRYAHEFGDCTAALREIALSNRDNATLNEAAVFQEPITQQDYDSARLIAEPLRLFDYCMVNDGAVALVMTRTPQYDSGRAIAIGGLASSSRQGSHYSAPDFYFQQSQDAAREMFAMANLSPDDIDLVQIYDNYTPSVLFSLEGFGFTKRGQTAEFVRAGHIRRNGSLPLNTSGGHTSEAYMQGMNLVAESVRQLRGEAGARQVSNASTACYMCVTPMSGGCVLWR